MYKNISKQNLTKVLIPIIMTVAVIAIVLAGYFYSQVRVLKKDPQAVAQKEVADLVAKVSRLLVLPTGETPTIATVSDLEALKDQVFFASAQEGDKVLIYAQAKKAILYSVTLNKIIEVAPLSIDTQNAITPPETTNEEQTTDGKENL